MLSYLENGIANQIYQLSIEGVLNSKNLQFIFESLEDFKNQNTKFASINLEFLSSSFNALISAQSALFTIFLLSKLMSKMMKMKKEHKFYDKNGNPKIRFKKIKKKI